MTWWRIAPCGLCRPWTEAEKWREEIRSTPLIRWLFRLRERPCPFCGGKHVVAMPVTAADSTIAGELFASRGAAEAAITRERR